MQTNLADVYICNKQIWYIYILTVTLWHTNLSRGVGWEFGQTEQKVGILTDNVETLWLTASLGTRHWGMGSDKPCLTSVCNAMAIEAVWGKCLLQSSVYPQQLTSVLCLPPTADLCPLFISSGWPLTSVYLQRLTSVLPLSPTTDFHPLIIINSWLPPLVFPQQLTSVFCCPKQLTFVCFSSTANFHPFF